MIVLTVMLKKVNLLWIHLLSKWSPNFMNVMIIEECPLENKIKLN